MRYWMIQRKEDGRLVSGTDYRYYPRRCIMSNKYRPPLLIPTDDSILEGELKRRMINLKRYKVVSVEIILNTGGEAV